MDNHWAVNSGVNLAENWAASLAARWAERMEQLLVVGRATTTADCLESSKAGSKVAWRAVLMESLLADNLE